MYRHHSGKNILHLQVSTEKSNDQTLLYLGAGAGPFTALVAQVQVEEDITALNTSTLQYFFYARTSGNFSVVVFAAAQKRTGARDAG